MSKRRIRIRAIFERYLSSAVNGDSDELHEFQKIRLRHVDAAGKKLMSVDKFRDPFHTLHYSQFHLSKFRHRSSARPNSNLKLKPQQNNSQFVDNYIVLLFGHES